ncbi:transposase [Microbacteriaceae bacterium 4G12]
MGVDDFAFRKGHTYGVLICDLTTHAPIAVLPDRLPETLTEWLIQYPHIEVVSRDGFTAFRQGISNANPRILQVYDRWHFIQNAKKTIRHIPYITSSLINCMERTNFSKDRSRIDKSRTRESRTSKSKMDLHPRHSNSPSSWKIYFFSCQRIFIELANNP